MEQTVRSVLEAFPVVALLGPRQVGKTTTALAIAGSIERASLYLDLERDSDRNKLTDAELYLSQQAGKLVILDEMQRQPELFPLLRSLIDERIRAGERAGHFLVLGSASRDLLQQSSESLAGRIAYLELSPFSLTELMRNETRVELNGLWLRGGFPDSYLAQDDQTSWDWQPTLSRRTLSVTFPNSGHACLQNGCAGSGPCLRMTRGHR